MRCLGRQLRRQLVTAPFGTGSRRFKRHGCTELFRQCPSRAHKAMRPCSYAMLLCYAAVESGLNRRVLCCCPSPTCVSCMLKTLSQTSFEVTRRPSRYATALVRIRSIYIRSCPPARLPKATADLWFKSLPTQNSVKHWHCEESRWFSHSWSLCRPPELLRILKAEFISKWHRRPYCLMQYQ